MSNRFEGQLPEPTVERLANAIHDRYVRALPERERAEARRWDELSLDARDQNRSQVRDIPTKLANVGREIVTSPERCALNEREVDFLARAEHDRWMSLARAQGYVYGPRQSTGGPKTHPDLVPWEELDDVAREKDRAAVRSIPELLESVGLGVAAVANPHGDLPAGIPDEMRLRIGVIGYEALTDQSKVATAIGAVIEHIERALEPDDHSAGYRLEVDLVLMASPRSTELLTATNDLSICRRNVHVVRKRTAHRSGTDDADNRSEVDVDVVSFEVNPVADAVLLTEVRVHGTSEPAHPVEPVEHPIESGDSEYLELTGDLPYKPEDGGLWLRFAQEVADRSDVILVMSRRRRMLHRRAAWVVEAMRYSRERRFRTFVAQPHTGRLLRKPHFRPDYALYARNKDPLPVRPPDSKASSIANDDPCLHQYVTAVHEYFEPYHARADLLAIKRKRLYYIAGAIVLVSAALALGAFAVRVLLTPETHWLRIVEVGAVSIAAGVQMVSTSRAWSRGWLTYRGLAERLRSAEFLAIAGHTTPRHPDARQHTGTEPWVATTAWEIWDRWTRTGVDRGRVSTHYVLSYLRKEWVVDQWDHHQRRMKRCTQREREFRTLSVLATLATVALLSLIATGALDDRHLSAFEFAAFLMPVGVGVHAGIREQREWRHYLVRSRDTARHLEVLAASFADLQSEIDGDRLVERLHDLALQVDEVVRHDLTDWFRSMELTEIRAD